MAHSYSSSSHCHDGAHKPHHRRGGDERDRERERGLRSVDLIDSGRSGRP